VELAIYLKNILYNSDNVIIPGFGRMLTKYKPAEINSSDNSIVPPSKYVIFEASPMISDGVLAKYIAQQKMISEQEAERYITDEVKSMNQKLDSGETIMLEGIGYLSKEQGNIRFEREQDANFFTDSFGLSKIDYKKVELKHTPQHNSEFTPVKRKINYLLWAMILSVMFIIGGAIVVYLFYPDLVSKYIKIQQTLPVQILPQEDTNTLSKNQKDTSRANDLEKFFDSATDKKKALAIKQETANTVKNRFDESYYIIAGSFNNFERASRFVKRLGKEGFKSEVIQFNQETFRVTIGEFKDKNQALAELLRIRAVKGDDAVWLLSK
jgi:nucleoid DNA-binding protein